jgi:septal ring factor EnvC (AmiA/AmiB activator)
MLYAQNSKKVKELRAQKTKLQKNLKQSQQALVKTGKDVKDGKSYLNYIDQKLGERVEHIRVMEAEMDSLEGRMKVLRSKISTTKGQLAAMKRRYAIALRFSRQFPKIDNSIVFILSAKSIAQMYRRARFAKEYAVFQHDLGRQILNKQSRLMGARNSLLKEQTKKSAILGEVIRQRKKLNDQQIRQQQYIKNLEKKEDNLKAKVSKQQKELNALNKKIDDLIAAEIEQARKRAEAEAKKKADAQKKSSSTSKSTAGTSKTAPKSSSSNKTPSSGSWLTPAEQSLNGTFVQNKGKLPVPITGQYRISGRFGQYNVPGLKNVTLDNKGVNYVGRPGARARSIFDGEVTAVFQFAGSKNVLVRHGSYISVYCNLSSVIVKKGQKLKARDIIGTIAKDESGDCVLHFQLRKETTKLNPEAWIGR